MKFFDYLATNHDINRFVFAVVVCYCLIEAAVAAYRGLKGRRAT
ncbi:hypothetical protein [Cupriavidus plantarum]